MRTWVLICLILCVNCKSVACIWEKASPAYWPSTNIPVCFVNNNSETQVSEKMNIIRNAYVRLNNKTDFQFSGFNSCSDVSPKLPAIRIQITTDAVGRAYSIGPASSTWPINMDLPSSESDVQLAGTTIHETLHLLGFHHDDQYDSYGVRKLARDTNLLVNGDYDPTSIMASQRLALSPNDIRCINLVAQKSFVSNRKIPPFEALEKIPTDNANFTPLDGLKTRSEVSK